MMLVARLEETLECHYTKISLLHQVLIQQN